MRPTSRPRKRHTRAQKFYERSRWIGKRIRLARFRLSEVADHPGRYEQSDPFDCGRKDCGCCRQGDNHRTARDRRLEVAARNELADFNDAYWTGRWTRRGFQKFQVRVDVEDMIYRY